MPLLAQVPTAENDAPARSGIRDLWRVSQDWWEKLDWSQIGRAVRAHLASGDVWVDAGAVAVSFGLAFLLARAIRKSSLPGRLSLVRHVRSRLDPGKRFPAFGLLLVLCLWSLAFFCGVTGLKCPLVRTVAVIASAAMAVTLPGLLARRPFWATPLVAVVITAAALHAFGLLETTVDRLAATGLKLGNLNISLLDLLVAPLAFLCFWTLAGMLSRFTESRLADARDIPPAVRVLAAKFTNFFLILAAIGFTLAVVGIDLTALTVFGGALGLGIGFGLQKVVSNLISGVILLLDKSIKPGDVIEIGDTYGRINGLRTRYVSVVTRDNKEHLIPNEDLITQPVINWSFTDRLVRLRAPIGIAYGSDVRLAIDLCEKAAAASPRVRKSPEPKCLLRGFGDSSVDLELRFFIEDPSEGCANVTSDVLLAVWDAFHEHGIEIPFPQRDLHLRSGGEVLREIFVKNPGAD